MVRNIFLIIIAAIMLCVAALNAQDKTKKEETKKMENQMAKETPGGKAKEIIVMETSMGVIELEMFREDAPKTVENFVQLSEKGYYDGIIFHRVMDKFMIQGGDPTGTGMGGESIYGKKFEDEISPKYKFDGEGWLAMANSGKNTNGSQFFITLVPTPWLNGNHTIFGKVVKGMEVVRAIGKVQVSPGNNKPLKPVAMNKVRLKKSGKAEEHKH